MKKPILYFDMDGVLVDFQSALMKNYLSFVLFVLSFLSCLSFTSCKGADGAQEEPLTANKLLMAIARETGDSAVKDFSAEMLDTIEMYMDSALVMVKDKNATTEQIVTAKGACLEVSVELLRKGGNCDKKRLERLVMKNIQIQFEFREGQNETQHIMHLFNVFMPEHHEADLLADYFDFYVFFDRKTKKCDSMLCVLPESFDNKDNKPQLFAFLKKGTDQEDTTAMEMPEPEYDEHYGVWQIMISGDKFTDIMNSDNLYFYATDNGEDGMESSTINLARFKEQYKEFVRQ